MWSGTDFESAVDAIVAGDAATLKKLLRTNPELVRARSEREHRSTLLHYVSANGVEDFRQKTPKNIVEIAKILLEAGADVDAESDAYGGGCTTLGLVATSVHPEKAGVQIPLLKLLLEYGARLDHPSAGGNNSSVVRACLANGQPAAAEFLAGLGAPVNLEAAAGLGRLVQVKTLFDEPGVTRKEIEAAFESACWYGRTHVVEYLLERGIDPGLRNDQGQTGLHCAAYGGHVELVKLLLEHGAPVGAKENSFDATALDVALWAWKKSQDATVRDACYEVIALLAKAGARLDREHWRDPESGESGMLDEIDSDPRMRAVLRGEGMS